MHLTARPTWLPFAALIGAAILSNTTGTSAQTPGELKRRGFEPVDQQIADVDPLRRSIRNVAPGLGPIGQESAVYRRTDGSDDRFYLVTPRYTASYDRSFYINLISQKGNRATAMMVPPNTVYHIGAPAKPYNTQNPAPDHPARVDTRLSPDAPGALGNVDPQPDAWAVYSRAKHSHKRDVLSALDRAMAPAGTSPE